MGTEPATWKRPLLSTGKTASEPVRSDAIRRVRANENALEDGLAHLVARSCERALPVLNDGKLVSRHYR
ncbi:MAG: hypothetical protein QOH91_2616 [Mycobacterium sp.]|nr:hypothetical protein [Mycobacterium sp.]